MFNLFSSKNEAIGIHSREVAIQIFDVRDKIYGAGSRSFKLPGDQAALDAFYNLAIYVANNFPFPKSHFDYLNQHLQVDCTQEKQEIINQLIGNRLNVKGAFALELLLRGIEVAFRFGDFMVKREQEAYLEELLNQLEVSFELKS